MTDSIQAMHDLANGVQKTGEDALTLAANLIRESGRKHPQWKANAEPALFRLDAAIVLAVKRLEMLREELNAL